MRARILTLGWLILTGCPKVVPPAELPPVPLNAQQQLAKEVDAIAVEALALTREQDELLWAHWTQGAALELDKPALAHAVLYAPATLDRVRLAKKEGIGNAVGVKRLEKWLVGERLARATMEANATLAGQEATATFDLDGKPTAWKDLSRLLANEKSAVKRRALWAASREAVPALAEGIKKRDDAVVAALAALGMTPEEYAGVTLESVQALAQKTLDSTDAEWKAGLTVLAKAELGLPLEKVTRADLPKLLRPSVAADAAFAKAEQAAKAAALLGTLNLYGQPGLTLDLAESAKKNPLPLTVAPNGAADVRVSVRPAGGVRDLSMALGEVGRGLAMHGSREPAEKLPRLADPLVADTTALLFAQLPSNAAWLKQQGVADEAAKPSLASSTALQLFALRKTAAGLLTMIESRGQTPEFAAESYRAWSARALSIQVPLEDAPRFQLERDPLYRGVELLQSAEAVAALRSTLAPEWWSAPETTAKLREAWAGQLSSAP